ncbi:DUF5994 family protein [Streptomyces sp. NBC_01476]|uniref:DUF5994 family protein n=1 Tax=Streptomyces sp. NBC_01476 TaxID=2903881 RepID=UPI002E37F4D8|nr:DUF5994 family protein [Streptomyces sp. NBC_01476]
MSALTQPTPGTSPVVAPLAAPVTGPPVRISLSAASTAPGAPMPGHGPLDGAWWPRSRDLAVELPLLIEALESRWGRVSRVAVNPRHWPVIPKKVALSGRVVHVGWFGPEQDPNALLLLGNREGRWDLLVIPPQTSEETAARLMAEASAPHNLRNAAALMAGTDGQNADLAA